MEAYAVIFPFGSCWERNKHTSNDTPMAADEHTEEHKIQQSEHRRCEKFKQKAGEMGLVRYMVRSLRAINAEFDINRFVECVPCDALVGAAMYYEKNGDVKIAACQNHLLKQSAFNVNLTHELIHVFDHARAEVDFVNNCYHHACTEIRAANLSGDCTYLRELSRGRLSVVNHHNVCVRRRAAMSVAANPQCGPDKAFQYVDYVWDRCIKDLTPFGSIPWQ